MNATGLLLLPLRPPCSGGQPATLLPTSLDCFTAGGWASGPSSLCVWSPQRAHPLSLSPPARPTPRPQRGLGGSGGGGTAPHALAGGPKSWRLSWTREARSGTRPQLSHLQMLQRPGLPSDKAQEEEVPLNPTTASQGSGPPRACDPLPPGLWVSTSPRTKSPRVCVPSLCFTARVCPVLRHEACAAK